MRFLNKRGIALVIVSNGPHQIVSNLLRSLCLESQTSPHRSWGAPRSAQIQTPVISNLLVCANSNCSQRLSCGNCATSFVTTHGAVGVGKGDIVKRLSAALPVTFATGNSIWDSLMIEETVRRGGFALIRPGVNPDFTVNSDLLTWARRQSFRILPQGSFVSFESYNDILNYVASKLPASYGLRLPLRRFISLSKY
jgi:hypothetical protein